MRLPRSLTAGLIAIAICCALVGCGALAPPATSASPSASRATAESPEPTASATPTATAVAEELVVSSGGLGPIKMGSRITADAPVRWNPTACVATGGIREGEPGAGIWESTIPLRGETALDRTQPFGVLTDGGVKSGTVSLLQVWSSQFRTPSGLHVGSTDAEVRAALPHAVRHEDELARWYTVTAGPWRITLTVPSETGEPVTSSSRVAVITVYPSTDGDVSWWGTDVGAYCST